MRCCRCNRTGSCKGCACVKAGKPCTACLPSELGSCVNKSSSASSIQQPVTAPTPINAPLRAGPLTAFLTPADISTHIVNLTLADSLPDDTGNAPVAQPVPTTHLRTPQQEDPSLQLPPFTPANNPIFTWGTYSAPDFIHSLEATYAEVVHWRRNCFTVPLGKAGKEFVDELSYLFQAFASASALESIALKSATILPILLLQKPHKASKIKEHITCLERRLKKWKEGNLNDLVLEGRAIQQRLPKTYSSKIKEKLARSFANLMFAGKCKAALDLLSRGDKGGILHLDDPSDPNTTGSPLVRDVLVSKHPTGQRANAHCIHPSTPSETHPVIFESIDAKAIRSAVLNTTGSAGPSCLDAHDWRRLCTSFKGASTNLCNSLASTARRICTTIVDPKSISPLLACRLIALDKSPGVRPIGIGDTARRIIAKAVLSVVRTDVQNASGCLQLCGGQISGIEAAVHAVRNAFNSNDCEAALLVDASNAFNSLNRQVALHNIRRLCPPVATALINNYRAPTELFVDGDVLLSQEGTTQGDPLAMPMYALATIPLIKKLEGSNKQVWYADDSAGVGKISDLRTWWDKLATEGPGYGYFANPSKTWLITKEGHHAKAVTTFAGTGVNITPEGRPYLGTAIGSQEYVETHTEKKVNEWMSCVNQLTDIARTQPHAAFAALTHGLMSKWTYLSRTTPNIASKMKPLDELLRTKLLPALTGQPPPSELECSLFALPARLGGLGINIPSKSADRELQSSILVTSALQDHILSQEDEYDHDIITEQLTSKATIRNSNKERILKEANDLMGILPDGLQRAVTLAREKGSSSWLTALPLAEHSFTLHKGAFHDALALRYGWTPSNMPAKCGCGSSFSVEHALTCAKGGFIHCRHNEIRDLTATLLTEVCKDVRVEPELQPVTHEVLSGATANTQDGARLDIAANGVWGGNFERTYFDVRVFNPHAPTNRHTQLASCYRKHEREKKRAYEQRVREVEHATFTPLVMAATGGLANEANVFYKRLASMLATKWDHSYSTTLCWLRCRLVFSLLRSSIQAIRGARSTCGHPIKPPMAIDLITSETNISPDP